MSVDLFWEIPSLARSFWSSQKECGYAKIPVGTVYTEADTLIQIVDHWNCDCVLYPMILWHLSQLTEGQYDLSGDEPEG